MAWGDLSAVLQFNTGVCVSARFKGTFHRNTTWRFEEVFSGSCANIQTMAGLEYTEQKTPLDKRFASPTLTSKNKSVKTSGESTKRSVQ